MDRMDIHATSLQTLRIPLQICIYILDSMHVYSITETFMNNGLSPTDSRARVAQSVR